MARETPPKTVPELVELPSSNLCVTSIDAAIFILMLKHVGLPLAQTTMAKLAICLSAWIIRYTKSLVLPEEKRQFLSESERVQYDFTFLPHA